MRAYLVLLWQGRTSEWERNTKESAYYVLECVTDTFDESRNMISRDSKNDIV